jgi:Sulfotransferase domain
MSRILARLSPAQLGASAMRAARMITANRRALPGFIIIGAQKAGTTSLHSYLSQHPQIRTGSKKEVHYFDLNAHHGERWYRSHFPYLSQLRSTGAGAAGMTGEASPYYLFHPHAAARIRSKLPNVRLVALLRDPVARAYSHYRHNLRQGHESGTFEEALSREEALLPSEAQRMREDPTYRSMLHQLYSYRARGRYAEQLQPYFDLFPRDQILILKSEDFFTETQEAFDRVVDFLGLGAWRLDAKRIYNVGRYEPGPIPCEEDLRTYFRPHNERLRELAGMNIEW